MGRDYGRNIRAVARLVSLNVSLPEEIVWRGRRVRTAFFKKPVEGPVFLSTLHLDGDGVGDPRYHGGREKAVYLYPFEHYAYWERELRRDDLSPAPSARTSRLRGSSRRRSGSGTSSTSGTRGSG